MIGKVNPNLATAIPNRILQNPYCAINIHAKDHSNHYRKQLTSWHRSDNCYTANWNGRKIIGLHNKNSVASVDLTESLNCQESGYYRIEIRIRKHPDDGGTVTLFDGSTQIEDPISCFDKWEHYEWIQYPVKYYQSGTHDLKISLTKQAFVESIKIEKINKHFWDTDGTKEPGSTPLHISYVDFTQNNINQLGTAKIKTAWKDEYYNTDNDYLPLNIGYTDSITITLGDSASNAIPLFGGYILNPKPNENSLELNCIDSLVTLQLQQLYQNFQIGVFTASDDTNKVPYTQFGSINELGRYFTRVCEYGLKDHNIEDEKGYQINFADPNQFNQIQYSGWNIQRDITNGMPAPSMKVTLGDTVGECEITLFNSSYPCDLAVYPMNFLHYYASGVGVRYPLEFDLKFTMYKAGETIDNAQDYIVRFTGKKNYGKPIIGSIKPLLDGTWHEIDENIKSMFDKYAPSTSYNVVKVSMVGEITQEMLDQKKCSAIWIDNPYSYKIENSATKYRSQNNVSTNLAELQNLMDKTNYVAYTKPGKERRDDTLMIAPEESELAPIAIDEVSNLIEISGYENNPHSKGFQNQAHIEFNFSQDNKGNAYYEDKDSASHFWPLSTHNFENDINNQYDANQLVQKKVNDNKYANKVAFTVKIFGCTLLNPAQSMAANILSSNLKGIHKIASIKQTLDFNDSPSFLTEIDMNYPSDRTLLNMMNTRRNLINIGIIHANQYYSAYNNYSIGKASPGGFNP